MESAFVVDSKGQCLFCQEKEEKGCIENSPEDEGEDKPHLFPFSLRRICHYLRINLNRDILIFRKGGNRTTPQDFSVMLCVKCYNMAVQLTELCMELELVQMRVNNAFRELVEVISTSMSPSLDSGVDTGVNVAKLLRERIKKLCTLQLQRTRQLSVKLRKCEGGAYENKTDFYDYEPPEKKSFMHSEIPESPKQEESQHALQNVAAIPTSFSSIADGIVASTQESSQKATPENDISCPFCNEVLCDSKRLKYHTITRHPDQLFSSAKSTEVSDEKFQSICMYLMKQETRFRLSNRFFKCAHCNVNHKERRRLMGHLVDIHYDYMTQKLEELQKQNTVLVASEETVFIAEDDPVGKTKQTNHRIVDSRIQDMLKKLPKKIVQGENKIAFECGLCSGVNSTILANQTLLEKHFFSYHSEYFFRFYRQSNVLPDKFKSDCEDFLNKCQIDSRAPGGTNMIVKRCAFCTNMYTEARILRRHQIKEHYEILCQKLVESLSLKGKGNTVVTVSPSYVCNICGISFSSIWSLNGHQSKRHPKKGTTSTNSQQQSISSKPTCPHCGMSFMCRYNLTRHMTKFCDTLRSCGMIPAHGGASFKNESGGNESQKCKFCAITFSSIFHFSRHMKLKHPQHVQNQLPQSQSNKSRPRCPNCNMDFVNGGNLNRHLKYSCVNLKKLGLLLEKPSNKDTLTLHSGIDSFEEENTDLVSNAEPILDQELVPSHPVVHINSSPVTKIDTSHVEMFEAEEEQTFYNQFVEETGEVMSVPDEDPLQT